MRLHFFWERQLYNSRETFVNTILADTVLSVFSPNEEPTVRPAQTPAAADLHANPYRLKPPWVWRREGMERVRGWLKQLTTPALCWVWTNPRQSLLHVCVHVCARKGRPLRLVTDAFYSKRMQCCCKVAWDEHRWAILKTKRLFDSVRDVHAEWQEEKSRFCIKIHSQNAAQYGRSS